METQKPMAQDMYLFNVCEYSRSEYKYKYWAVKYEYKYECIAFKYKYKYLKYVLEYYSSTSTSTKYYSAVGKSTKLRCITYRLNGSRKSIPVAAKPETHISACRQDIIKNSTPIPECFVGLQLINGTSSNAVPYNRKGKFKIAALEPERTTIKHI